MNDLIAKQCYFTITAKKTVPDRVWKYEDQYRGREFPGFSNYRTFEDIIKEQIRELEQPAMEILNKAMSMAQALVWGTLTSLFSRRKSSALTDAFRILQSVEVNLIQPGDCPFSRAFNLYTWPFFPVALGRELENNYK